MKHFKWAVGWMGKHKILLALSILVNIVGVGLMTVEPYIFADLVDNVLMPQQFERLFPMLGLLVWFGLLEKQKYPTYSNCGGFWHRDPGWSVCLSHCFGVYGDAGRGDCLLCLYYPVSDFYCGWCSDFCRASGSTETNGRTWNIQIRRNKNDEENVGKCKENLSSDP